MLRIIVGGCIPVAGCLSGPLLKEDPEGVILGKLSIGNRSKQHHEVTVTVLYDGETAHSQKYSVGPREGKMMGGQILDIPHADSPGSVEIRASMDDHQERVTNLDKVYDEGCIRVMIHIERNGSRISFLTNREPRNCPDESSSATEA